MESLLFDFQRHRQLRQMPAPDQGTFLPRLVRPILGPLSLPLLSLSLHVQHRLQFQRQGLGKEKESRDSNQGLQ